MHPNKYLIAMEKNEGRVTNEFLKHLKGSMQQSWFRHRFRLVPSGTYF